MFGKITFRSSEEIDLPRVDDLQNIANNDSINNSSFTVSEGVFTDLYDGVTCPEKSIWLPSLAPSKKSLIINDPELEDCADLAHHQVCAIVTSAHDEEVVKESEAFDS